MTVFLEFQEKHKGLDPTTSPRALSKFLKEAKRVKQVLSANTETFSQVCDANSGCLIIYLDPQA